MRMFSLVRKFFSQITGKYFMQMGRSVRQTEAEMEEACTVIAELADYYPVRYLYTIFSKAGRVKYIRVANPKDPDLAGCSTDVLKEFVHPGRYSKKEVLGLHVVVQYDTAEEAIKSIYLLNCKALPVRPRSDYYIASECDLDQAEKEVYKENEGKNHQTISHEMASSI